MEVEGLVIPAEDPVALANAITKLARDKDQRLKMGEMARQRVLEGCAESHVISAVVIDHEIPEQRIEIIGKGTDLQIYRPLFGSLVMQVIPTALARSSRGI